jgi:hypothetical protein
MRDVGGGDLEAIHARAKAILERPAGEVDHEELAELRERALSAALTNNKKEKGKGKEEINYPDVLDPAFATRLLAKREFRQHAVDAATEDVASALAGRCERLDAFFEHTTTQLLVRNFMSPLTPYNGLLLAHGTGLGKTCAAITIAEQYAPTMRNGVTIITRPPLVDAFRRTIFDVDLIPRKDGGSLDFARASSQCTGTTYPDMVVDRHILSASQLDARISRTIRDRYAFLGPLKFSNRVHQLCTDPQGEPLPAAVANQRLKEHFSDSVLIIDEAHMLRGGDGKKLGPALRKVLKVSENVKLLLLTATPMFNEATDILDIVNILLINDKRPPLKPSDVFDKASGRLINEAALAAALKGYVSYAASDDPFSFPRCLSAHEASDPGAMAPSDVPSRALSDGAAIPPQERLKDLQRFILATPMGPAQSKVVLAITASIQQFGEKELVSALPQASDGDAEEGDAEEEDKDKKKRTSDVLSKLSQLMQASNVVFPRREEGGRGNSNGSFDEVFERAKGSRLHVSYRKGVAPFLSAPHISKWAPKLHAIVSRVKTCQGVAMVYSRFIWSGLVPLAIALEHAGFVPHRGAPILSGGGGGGRNGGNRYAIISGQNIAESTVAQVLADATHPENADGRRIKVILISDKGSEGLSLKFVREVHVMEPWFHLNKVDQVLGRASRLCSHALLPPQQRNVTLFLHAITGNKENRETIDLFTYRQAEMKQGKIAQVEAILKQQAFDCSIMAPYKKRLRATLDRTRVTLVTSQGRALKNRSLESSRVTGSSSSHSTTCAPSVDVLRLAEDASTYDPAFHAHHQERYRALIGGFFADTNTTSASEAEIWAYVKQRMPSADRMQSLRELHRVVGSHTTVSSRLGRQGYILHRGTRYLFQPFDEASVILTNAERAQIPQPPTHIKAVSLFSGPAPTGTSATDAYLRHDDRIHHAIKVLTELTQEASDRLHGVLPPGTYENVALDSVVDNLSHADLLDVAKAVMLPREVHDLLPSRVKNMKFAVRRSLIISRILSANGQRISSPFFPQQEFALDENSGEFVASPKQKPKQNQANGQQQKAVASISRIGNNTRMAFKVLDPLPPGKLAPKRGAARSGCVCHQSSTVSLQQLTQRIAEIVPSVKGQIARLNKRALCELYEIALRKHRPQSILRPIF